jgi:hypothetical protein
MSPLLTSFPSNRASERPNGESTSVALVPDRVKLGTTMKWRKKPIVKTPEERAEHERRSDARQREPDCHTERIEAELASQKPGAAGLTVRSRRPRC